MANTTWRTVWCTSAINRTDRGNVWEIVLPPSAMILTIMAGAVWLFTCGRVGLRRKGAAVPLQVDERGVVRCQVPFERNFQKIEQMLGSVDFYLPFDLEVITSMEKSINRFRSLATICVPCFVSMSVSALVLFFSDALLSCLWPSRQLPNVNTAVTCFLMPAGFVYALSFGFVYSFVADKQSTVLKKVMEELSLLDQIITMATNLQLPSHKHLMVMCQSVKCELIFMALLVQNKEPDRFKHSPPNNLKVRIWRIVDVLRDAASHDEQGFRMNATLAREIVGYVVRLNNICYDRMGSMHIRIPVLKWVFLEVLGALSLFGVMLVEAFSSRMEYVICWLTMFSTSMLCFVIADLDSPFNGFFRVDLSVMPLVLQRASRVFHHARQLNDDRAAHFRFPVSEKAQCKYELEGPEVPYCKVIPLPVDELTPISK